MSFESTNEVEEALREFGLSPKEAAVYGVLLRCGARPATIIAEKAGLKRGQTYNILRTLIQRGLAQEFLKSGVLQFANSPPTVLRRILEEQADDVERRKGRLEALLPALLEMQPLSLVAPKLRLFLGIEGLKEIYEGMLDTPGSSIYSLIDARYDPLFSKGANLRWINRFIARRAARNIWWNGIVNQSPESDRAVRERSGAMRRIKMIRGIELPVSIHVYGAKTAITSSHKEQVGFVIENEPLATSLRNIHQGAWQSLPDYECADSQLACSADARLSGRDDAIPALRTLCETALSLSFQSERTGGLWRSQR